MDSDTELSNVFSQPPQPPLPPRTRSESKLKRCVKRAFYSIYAKGSSYASRTITLLKKAKRRILETLGLNPDQRPNPDSVALALLSLGLFLAVGTIAIVKHSKSCRIIVTAFNLLLTLALGIQFIWDLFILDRVRHSTREYSRNATSTLLTVLFTIVSMTALYNFRWYHGLNLTVVKLLSDQMEYPRFPAIAFLQGSTEPSAYFQGSVQLQHSPLKCYSGAWDEHSPRCGSLTKAEAITTQSCDCCDEWRTSKDEVDWYGSNTSYLALVPGESTVSKGPGHFLALQIFFSYNATQSKQATSVTLSPNVWVAIYDASHDFKELYARNDVQISRIDANSYTIIDAGLRYQKSLHGSPFYKYDLQISTSPNVDLVCDTGKEDWYFCHTTFQLQIPNTLRTIVQEEKELTWSSVVAEAGAYFALVQFFSWTLSGQAWAL